MIRKLIATLDVLVGWCRGGEPAEIFGGRRETDRTAAMRCTAEFSHRGTSKDRTVVVPPSSRREEELPVFLLINLTKIVKTKAQDMALYTTESAVNAVVAEIGGYATKIGYAGEDCPRAYFRSVRRGRCRVKRCDGSLGVVCEDGWQSYR
jgi:Actin